MAYLVQFHDNPSTNVTCMHCSRAIYIIHNINETRKLWHINLKKYIVHEYTKMYINMHAYICIENMMYVLDKRHEILWMESEDFCYEDDQEDICVVYLWHVPHIPISNETSVHPELNIVDWWIACNYIKRVK